MNKIFHILIIILSVYCTACSDDDDSINTTLEFKSSSIENNAVDVPISTTVLEVSFNGNIKLAPQHGITINDEAVSVEASLSKLIFTISLAKDRTYQLNIPKEAVLNADNIPLSKSIQISFATEKNSSTNLSGLDFVANMGVGWNLGNTLDSKGNDETVWGNPKASQELINAISAKGFNTLRVPATWQYHIGNAPEYKIEKEWLDRVEEVINYGLSKDMYVILNIHHDEEWLIPTYTAVDKSKDQLGKVWTQIAERFKDYNNKLIFETLNETRLKGSAEEWNGGSAEGRDCINQFHKTSVNAIRETGSENADRYIMISSYAASSSQAAIDGLVLPSSSNLIVSIHSYFPYELCLGSGQTEWGSDADKQALDAEFDKLQQKFISKGIPVVMGEWGTTNHNNTEARIIHASYYANGCLKRGICPIWWDNGNTTEFGIINRQSLKWEFPEIANAVVNAHK